MERHASNKGVDSYKHQRLNAITVNTALPEHILDLRGAGAMQEGEARSRSVKLETMENARINAQPALGQ